MIDFKMHCFMSFLVLQSSVETQLGKVVNFVNFFVEYFFLFPLVKTYKDQPRNAEVIIENKVARFYGPRCT